MSEPRTIRETLPDIYSAEWHTARADDLEAGNTDGLTEYEVALLIQRHRIAARAIKGENK